MKIMLRLSTAAAKRMNCEPFLDKDDKPYWIVTVPDGTKGFFNWLLEQNFGPFHVSLFEGW